MADLLGSSSLSSKSRLNKSGQLRQQNLPGDGLLELQESYSSYEETMRSESDKDVAYTDNEFELRNQSFEQHVYNELSAIRDKLKRQFQKLADDEHYLQDYSAALEEREREIGKREREIEEREKELEGREGQEREVEGREREVEEREREVEEKEREVEERERGVEEREREVEEKEMEVEEREREMEDRERELEEREREVEEREREVEERERGVEEREGEVEASESRVEKKARELREHEKKVCEMEQLAREAHDVLTHCIEHEVAKRLQEWKEQGKEEVAGLSAALQEKARENQRLRNSFDTIKQGNDGLRKQLQEISERNSHLESQMASIQGRLVNLQRRNEYVAAKQQRELSLSEELAGSTGTKGGGKKTGRGHKNKKSCSKPSTITSDYYSLLGTLMSWLCRVHLSLPLHPDHHHHAQQHCRKTLPLLATLLPQVPATNTKLQLSLLEFIYWAVTHLTTIQQKSTLSSTLRRIGEEIYKPAMHSPSPHGQDSPCTDLETSGAFFRSQDLHTRILSSLLTLKTLTQVDRLAHVFDTLRQDLKEDIGKELFLGYHGVETVLPFMKPSNKALCAHAVDIYLQLSVESTVLSHFLSACSSEEWFAASTALLKESRAVDVRTLEKLSIILQRLSKIKSNRRMFECFQLPVLMQELLRTHANPDNSFLTLNLQSVLLNLTSRH